DLHVRLVGDDAQAAVSAGRGAEGGGDLDLLAGDDGHRLAPRGDPLLAYLDHVVACGDPGEDRGRHVLADAVQVDVTTGVRADQQRPGRRLGPEQRQLARPV